MSTGTGVSGSSADFRGPSSLVPYGDLTVDFSVAPFLGLVLASLRQLSSEASVQDYVSRAPGLRPAIQSLALAVADAGVRVRDSGELRDSFDENLPAYTPGEIWVFNLAIDLIALLGGIDDLPGGTRAMIASNLGSLDRDADSRRWKKELRSAGPRPEAFRELRARIPGHTLNPEPSRGGHRSPDGYLYMS
jgi:hypothetical protein